MVCEKSGLGARRTQKLEKIVGEIRAAGGTAEFKAVDVSNREDMKAFIHFARDKFGRVDVIFNNAGVMPLSPMNALKVEEWDSTINVNIYGVLNGIAAGLPIMEAQGGGQFINTASISAHVVGPNSAVYSATKFAVWAISEGLRQESKKIRVTTLAYVLSKFLRHFRHRLELNKEIMHSTPNFWTVNYSDRLSQNTKIGLKYHFFHSTSVHLERASTRGVRKSTSASGRFTRHRLVLPKNTRFSLASDIFAA
ncbi:MAG: SDR family oxidoreductase [Nostoc sp.]